MLNSSNGLFFFQFSSKDGLDAMLENGLWFIRNNPLILKSGIGIEDRLSVIATKLGTLLMLDSYTSDMCMQSWGRSSYARPMIELRADVELKYNIVLALPKLVDKLEHQLIDGKLMFMDDDDENSLVHMSNADSKRELEVAFDETTNLLAPTSSKGGNDRVYGNNILLEQWREIYQDDDYDPYDEDLYESHDMCYHLHAICDNLDITICDRKKKFYYV
ncbi:hypothetical protein Tco_0293934 [Tanacetum coccineum]